MNSLIYVIGENIQGELGLNHTNHVNKLTCFNEYNSDLSITNIKCADTYTYYINENNDNTNHYACGYNEKGCCGVYHYKNINKCSLITWFKTHQIKIKQLCVSVAGRTTFWITNKNTIYGHGNNTEYQLGLNDTNHRDAPRIIPNLTNIINILSGYHHSIALSSSKCNDNIIIKHWIRKYNKNNISMDDIIPLIHLFSNHNKVYSTGGRNVNLSGHGLPTPKVWTEIAMFNKINITQITVGAMHSLFLEGNGNVWACGSNLYGQLGCKTTNLNLNTHSVTHEMKIKYFNKNKINIRMIKSGKWHNFAVDINDNIYCWGYNQEGACGDGTLSNIHKPKVLPFFDEKYGKIKNVKCGAFHSYVMTQNDEHYLFGYNLLNICLTNDGRDKVSVPHCINNIVEKEMNNKRIKDVFLGHMNTIIMMQ
eukprot:378962_1